MSIVAYALTNRDKVKRHLDITETTWDVLFDDLVDSCTNWIEKTCGNRRFFDAATNVTEYHDGGDLEKTKTKIFLKQWPINALSSVSYRSGDYDSPTWNAYSAKSDYIRDDQSGVIHCMFTLPWGFQNIRVIYQGGYTTIPQDLELACTKLVAKEWTRRRSQGVMNESVGGAAISWELNLDPDLMSILNAYKRFAV